MSARQNGFDFTAAMRLLIADMIGRVPPLRHIDLSLVAISFCQARKRVAHGMQAKLTPMRFENGQTTGESNGRQVKVQKLLDSQGREMLYILSFYLPRFLDLTFEEKMVTIFHELWHINPRFNGDLRRHPGRCYAHTVSEKEYDAQMARLADQYLAAAPPEGLYEFLKHDFDALAARYGSVGGLRIAQPKLIPLDKHATRQ